MSCRTARLSAWSPHCEALRWGILKWPQAGDFGWPPGVITSRSITHPHGGDLDGIVRYLRCPS
jgi:hypothetical protein